jgi:hypothetical protein
MSMELYVLCDRHLASIEEWQRAISAEGFPLHLSDDTPLEKVDGILPVQLEDKRTDFECTRWSAREVIEGSPEIDFGRPWTQILAFRWGGDLYALPAAYMAGAAYARATDGIVFDCEEGKIFTPEQAAENARDILRDMPSLEATVRLVVQRVKAQL